MEIYFINFFDIILILINNFLNKFDKFICLHTKHKNLNIFIQNINNLLIHNFVNIHNIKKYFYIEHNYFSNSKNHKL
jgi:hypothetical protein